MDAERPRHEHRHEHSSADTSGTDALSPSPSLLRRLEGAGAALRRVGLGRVVDRLGVHVGSALARMRTVEVDGLALRGSHAGHLWYLQELAEGREATLARVVRAAAVPGRRAVDGGAHLGYVTLLMARAGARVTAFEPAAGLQRALQGNIARNVGRDAVEIRREALGSGTGRLLLSPDGSSATLARGVGEPVTVVALDDVLPPDDPPAVVKLDLEGWEVEALRGMRRLLAGDAVVVVECNPGALGEAGTSPAALVELLTATGREIHVIDEDTGHLRPFDAAPAGGYVNLVAVRAADARRLSDALSGPAAAT